MSVKNITKPTKKVGFWKRAISNKYEVTIVERGPEGVQFEEKIVLSKIKKITPNHIKGLDMEGRLLEYYSAEPFNYYIVQHY